jgi:hypothetical protein
VTGEVVSQGILTRPEGAWDVNETLGEFKQDTEDFVQLYFGEGEKAVARVEEYEQVLTTMLGHLKALKRRH